MFFFFGYAHLLLQHLQKNLKALKQKKTFSMKSTNTFFLMLKKNQVLTYSLPLHAFSNPWKDQKIVRLSDVFMGKARKNWEQIG